MTFIRYLTPTSLLLVLALAACGGTAPTPTPQPPAAPAPTPEPPVGEPVPNPDDSQDTYIGQWQVLYTGEDGTSFAHLLDITTDYNDSQEDGSFGSQQLCTGEGASPCDETSSDDTGVAFIGTVAGEDGAPSLSLVIYDKNGRRVYTTENLTTETDAQDRQVLTGPAIWVTEPGQLDGTPGTVTATSVNELSAPPPGAPVNEGPLTGVWSGTIESETLGELPLTLDLFQGGSEIDGPITVGPPPTGNEAPHVVFGTESPAGPIYLYGGVPIDGAPYVLNFTGNLSEGDTTFSGRVSISPAQGSDDPEFAPFTTTSSPQ